MRELGAESYAREGPPLLERAIASVRERGLALKGPTSTPAGRGFRSINLALRNELDLYAGDPSVQGLSGRADSVPRHRRGRREDEPGGPLRGHRVRARRGGHGAAARGSCARPRGVELAPDAGVSLKPLSRTAAGTGRAAGVRVRARATAAGVTAVHKATVMRAHRRPASWRPAARSPADTPTSTSTIGSWTTSATSSSRTPRSATCCSARSCTATSSPTSARAWSAVSGMAPGREPRRRRGGVRGRARLGPPACGPRPREPVRADALRRDAAAPRRRGRRGRAPGGRDRAP